MSDPLKVRISRNLLKYEQSGLPHTKSFFAFTSLAITLTPEFTASQDHVVSLILNLKLFKGKDAQREPTIVALNPEKYKDGKEAPRPKRKVRPGLLDTDGDQSKVWERASHHLLGSEWGPEWRTRPDISITGAGVETNSVTWKISLAKGSNGTIPANLPTALVVLHRGPFLATLSVSGITRKGQSLRSSSRHEFTDSSKPALTKILYFDGNTSWDKRQAVWEDLEHKKHAKEEEERKKKEEEEKEGDFGEEEAYNPPGPSNYIGSIEDPA